MTQQKKYMAGSVPRAFRLMRPGLFPPTCLIGSLVLKGRSNGKGGGTTNIIRDVIMMTQASFQSMKANVSVNLVLSPTLKLGGSDFTPGFVFTDTKEVVVPPDEPNPELFAKTYFLKKFGIAKESSGLFKAAQELFLRGKAKPEAS